MGKYKLPLIVYSVFTIIGFCIWYIRDIRYFALFNGIGTTELISSAIIINHPQFRQPIRRAIQIFIALLLLGMLGFIFGVNFQFEQIFFDIQAGVVTGALIQFIIARIIVPIFYGNAFCSHACWDGAFFEVINPKKLSRKKVERKEWLAWLYLIILIVMSIIVAQNFTNPAGDDNETLRKKWIVGQNIFILLVGFILTIFCGSRAYCRMLCPFMTISSLFYKRTILKITPIASNKCTQCGACNNICPMLIDIKESVKNCEKIATRQCILCEQCVSVCKQNVLMVTNKAAK